jgi:hypothetical protein
MMLPFIHVFIARNAPSLGVFNFDSRNASNIKTFFLKHVSTEAFLAIFHQSFSVELCITEN